MKITSLFILLITALSFQLLAQDDYKMFVENDKINPADSNKIFLKIRNVNFMKNNEFFNQIHEGYTLFGYWIRPELEYHPTSKSKLEAGVHIGRYDGLSNYAQVIPTFRFQYAFNPNMSIVFGTLYGGINHQLIDPFYKFERNLGPDYVTKANSNIENGFQFLTDFKHFKSDIWIDWQNFIYRYENQKEQINAGISARILVTNPESKFQVTIPCQWFIRHFGGQETGLTTPLSSIMDYATGLKLSYKLSEHNVVGASYLIAGFKDISPNPDSLKKGAANYLSVFFNSHYINFSLSYWNANRFLAPCGEELYQSKSTLPSNVGIYIEPRVLLAPKIYIHHELFNGCNLAASYEMYRDLKWKDHNDFYYALYLVFNQNVFIKKLPQIASINN